MKHAAGNRIPWRFARPDDLNALVALLGILFGQEADFGPDETKQRRALEMILSEPDAGRVLCVEIAGQVVGMAGLLFVPSARACGLACWLEDVVVLPDWRGRGIGRVLLEAAIETARKAGCRRVMLLTDHTNTKARGFYRRLGFEPVSRVPMRRIL